MVGEHQLKFIEIAWNSFRRFQDIQEDTEYFVEFYYD